MESGYRTQSGCACGDDGQLDVECIYGRLDWRQCCAALVQRVGMAVMGIVRGHGGWNWRGKDAAIYSLVYRQEEWVVWVHSDGYNRVVCDDGWVESATWSSSAK